MRKVVIINQKGGVGKTTTVVNLASGLARNGKKVCIIDLDPQGNVSTCLNVRSENDIYDVIIEGKDPNECVVQAQENLDVITSRETLTKAEMILVGEQSRETILRRALEPLKGYDFVFIDCAPSLGLLNQNAILFADEIFIPASTDVLALTGLANMIKAIDKINEVFEHKAAVTTIIPTLYDQRNKICKDALKKMQEQFQDKVADPIRVNSKLKESPGSGKSIFGYDNSSRGAKDYRALVERVQSTQPQRITVQVRNPNRKIVRRTLQPL